jgi:DNA processing protein
VLNLQTGPGLAALLTVPGIGEKRALALADRFGTWDEVVAASPEDMVALLGAAAGRAFLDQRPATLMPPPLPPGSRVLSRHDQDYPAALASIPNAPTLLWVLGTVPPPEMPTIAVVGTRHPSEYGDSVARLVSEGAVSDGIGIISGLANGIDARAHATTIDAGGRTWAVLGSGIDGIEHGSARSALAVRILDTGGGLISEVPPGTPTATHLLTRRNRLQSGLSRATVIAQSGLPGARPAGTMHTARFAIEQDRLLVVGRPSGRWATEDASAGNMALTDPTGCDPQAVYASKPEIAAKVASRTPVADVVLTGRADLPELWRQVHQRPAVPAASNVDTARADLVEVLTLPMP